MASQRLKIKNSGLETVKILRESEEHLTHKMDQSVWTIGFLTKKDCSVSSQGLQDGINT